MTKHTREETKYWIGIASHDHVQAAVNGGFCQLGHGKEAPVLRLRRGDLIVFYSPRERMGEGPALRPSRQSDVFWMMRPSQQRRLNASARSAERCSTSRADKRQYVPC
jgi:hypothetical protein